jgi:hypothetical protein
VAERVQGNRIGRIRVSRVTGRAADVPSGDA